MLTKTSSRLVAFAAAVAVIGGAAAAVGSTTSATPPLQDCLKVAALEAGLKEDMGGKTSEHGDGEEPMVEAVLGAHGLTATLAGLEIRPEPQQFTAGASTPSRFRVVDCKADALREFEPENGKLLHLIVVRSDFTGQRRSARLRRTHDAGPIGRPRRLR